MTMEKENKKAKEIFNSDPIKAMFETGKISKMWQLSELSPTKMSKLLHLNYGRYMEKLANPELFTLKELVNMSKILDMKFKSLVDVVTIEISKKIV